MSTARADIDTSLATTESTPGQPTYGSGVPSLLIRALEDGNAADVLWTLRRWMIHNETHNVSDNYRDGRWWTYSSLKLWCERDFPFLTPRKLGTIMDKLLKLNLIVRQQYQAKEFRMSYWYSVNEDVLTSLMEKEKRANALNSHVKSMRRDRINPSDTEVQSKTVVKEKNLKPKQSKPKQTTTRAQAHVLPQTDVVVVEPPRPAPEHESGEYDLNSEGQDHFAVKAKALAEHQHHEDLPKVPQKGFPPTPLLVAKLVHNLGFEAGFAETLIHKHGANRVRAVAMYTAGQEKIHTPPAFIRSELDRNELGLGVCDDETWDLVIKHNHQIDTPDDDLVIELNHEAPPPPPPPPAPGVDAVVKNDRFGGITAEQAFKLMLVSPNCDILKRATLAAYDPDTHAYHITVPSGNVTVFQERFSPIFQREMQPFHNGPFSLVFSASDSGAGQTLNSNQTLEYADAQ